MSAGFDDDEAFKNLAKRNGFMFHKLSYFCADIDCKNCDGRIHYNVKQFKERLWSAETGKFRDVYEDIVWNPEFRQVQLEGGVLQNRENTPEGSKCECFCHKSRPKNAGPPQFAQNIPAIPSKLKSEGKKLHEMLSTEEKKNLK